MQNGERRLCSTAAASAASVRWTERGLSDGGRAVLGGPMRSVGGWGKPDFNNYKQATPTVDCVVVVFAFLSINMI